MMKNKEQITPSDAWGRSLSRALLWPLGIYFLVGLVMLVNGGFGGMAFALIAGLVGLLIHFIAYFLVGLPAYICFWRTWPDLWTWKVGPPVGVCFGGFTFALMNLPLKGSTSLSEFGAIFIFGGAYGLITAAAAITSRKKNTWVMTNLKTGIHDY